MSPTGSLRSQSLEKETEIEPGQAIKKNNEYDDAEKNYKPKTIKFWIPLIGMYLALFLVALVSRNQRGYIHISEFVLS
jgi:hypothetical protein